MQHDQTELLTILRAGFNLGAFEESEQVIQDAIRLCTSGLMAHVKCQRASGYQVSTHLLSFPEFAGIQGLVIKTMPRDDTKLVAVTSTENEVLRQLGAKTVHYSLPRCLGAFESQGLMVFVTEMLPGNMATEMVIGEEESANIAQAIEHLQRSLSGTSVGKEIIVDTYDGRKKPYYVPKVKKFIETHLNLVVDERELIFLEVLELFRNRGPVIVSDRNPTNMILANGRVCMFDFGLLLAGVAYEDWSWFIDDPRLNSSLARDALVQVFCDSLGGMLEIFHLAALFVCVKQYCLMKSAGRIKMALHYIERAEQSARALGSEEALALISKLKPTS